MWARTPDQAERAAGEIVSLHEEHMANLLERAERGRRRLLGLQGQGERRRRVRGTVADPAGRGGALMPALSAMLGWRVGVADGRLSAALPSLVIGA